MRMPPRTGLTERAVAAKALELIDADGLDGLSIRKLATELGVSPMTLYTYFPDRDALLEAAAQLLYAEIEAPPDDTLGPQDTVRHIMRSVRRVILRHPNTVTLVAKYPPRTLDALAFVEAGYRSFSRAGITPLDTARAYRALAVYSIGTAEIEINRYFAHHPAANLPAKSLDTPTLQRHLPNVTKVGPLLDQLDDTAEFDYGLDLILDGFTQRRGHGDR
jgi:AcrR family transcriptional regulator